MKKKTLLTLLPLFLLSGCAGGENPTPSSSDTPKTLGDALTLLKTGFSLEAVCTEVNTVSTGSGSQTTYRNYTDVALSEGRYSNVTYKQILDPNEPNKENVSFEETYVSNEGKLSKIALSLQNTIETENSSVSYSDSNLVNPFENLKESDFLQKGGVYLFSTLNLEFEERLGTILHGYRASKGPLSSFTLDLSKDEITFTASFDAYTETMLGMIPVSVERSYEGKFVSYGEEVPLPTPIAEAEDSAFKEAMGKLHKGNYALSSKNEEIKYQGGRFQTVGIAEAEKGDDFFTYTIRDQANAITDDSMYFEKDGKLQRAVRYEDIYYAAGKVFDGDVMDYWPSFGISSAFFTKEGNVYTLKSDYRYLLPNTSFLTPLTTDRIGTLTVAIEEDKVTFVNENEGNGTTNFGNRETLIYSSFGEVTSPSFENVHTNCDDLSWKQAIRSKTDYRTLATTLGGEANLSLIPFFGGIYPEASISEQETSTFLYTKVDSKADGDALEALSETRLLANGFTVQKDTDGSNLYAYALSSGKTLLVAPFVLEQDGSLLTTPGIFFGYIIAVQE